jgi:hypothetical protein
MTDSPHQKLLDPPGIARIGQGFVVGLLVVGGFFLLATVMGLPTFVDQADIPMQ